MDNYLPGGVSVLVVEILGPLRDGASHYSGVHFLEVVDIRPVQLVNGVR